MDSAVRKPLLSVKQIFWLWLPLAATWILMASEGPLVNALVARMYEARDNLAALGVAISVSMLLESPIFLILSASIALVDSWQDFLRLRRFTIIVSAGLSLLLALVFTPDFFALICRTILDLPPEIADKARVAGFFCVPIPLAVAYRRFYQGILIKNRRGSLVAAGTLIRFLTMAVFALLFYLGEFLPGASSGALALTLGMLAEAVVAREFANPSVRQLEDAAVSRPPVSYPAILRFYLPLAANSMIFMAIQPLLTFFLSHTVQPVNSLAVFPIVWGSVFLFVAQGIALQEIILSQLGENQENKPVLLSFTFRLAAGVALMLALVFFSPFSHVVYFQIFGLSEELAVLAAPAACLLSVMPFLTLWGAWQRAMHMHRRKTVPITVSSAIEVVVAAAVMWLLPQISVLAGVILAPFALAGGRIAGVMWLEWSWRSIRSADRIKV